MFHRGVRFQSCARETHDWNRTPRFRACVPSALACGKRLDGNLIERPARLNENYFFFSASTYADRGRAIRALSASSRINTASPLDTAP